MQTGLTSGARNECGEGAIDQEVNAREVAARNEVLRVVDRGGLNELGCAQPCRG